MDKKNQKKEIQDQFQRWETDFLKLQAELKSAAKAVGAESSVSQDLESLHDQMNEARDELEEIEASGEAWEEFRETFDEAWKTLKEVVENVVARYRETAP